jgi:hypothetical protein
MEIAVVLVVVVLGGLVLCAGLAVPLAIGWLARDERAQKRAEASASALLDQAFAGQPTVVYTVTSQSMRYETVVLGARERGYQLLSESLNPTTNDRALVFAQV